MKTIVICNQKGGVGKTTTTSALGAYLVNKGYRVLTIDSDPQGNLSSSIGINPDEVSTLDDLMTGKNTIQQVIIKTAIGDLVPCSLSLSDADRRFTQFKAFEILKNILSEINDSRYRPGRRSRNLGCREPHGGLRQRQPRCQCSCTVRKQATENKR